jgi:hypothetical protein
MSREYSYRTSQKILWTLIGDFNVLLPIPLFFISIYLYFFKDGDIFAVLMMTFCTLVLVPLGVLAINFGLKTRLLINREGLVFKSPTILLTVGWEDMRICEAMDQMGKYLAVYSSEMEVQKIGLGQYIPGTADKDTLMKGVQISRFLGDDIQEIARLLISFRDQQ